MRSLIKKVLKKFQKISTSDYKDIWNSFQTVGDARQHIYNDTDEAVFDAGGKMDAEWVSTFLDEESVVLDIGCGIGRIEKFLAPSCKELCGVDISERMLEEARRRLSSQSHVSFYQNNGKDLSVFEDQHFDFIFSFYVLQHIEREDAYGYLKEIHRILKDQSRTFLQFPALTSEYFDESFLGDVARGGPYTIARPRLYTVTDAAFVLLQVGLCPEEQFQRGSDIFLLSRKATPNHNTYSFLKTITEPYSHPRFYIDCHLALPSRGETLLTLSDLASRNNTSLTEQGTLDIELIKDELFLDLGERQEKAFLIEMEFELQSTGEEGTYPDFSLGVRSEVQESGLWNGPYLQTDSGHDWTLRTRNGEEWGNLEVVSKGAVPFTSSSQNIALVAEEEMLSLYDTEGCKATARIDSTSGSLFIRSANTRIVLTDFTVSTLQHS